jgi:predicted enzyme related to lactoylglutathione lyase
MLRVGDLDRSIKFYEKVVLIVCVNFVWSEMVMAGAFIK